MDAPTPRTLPKLALWMASCGLKPPAAEAALGVRANQVRKYLRPFDDPERVIPPLPVMERIVRWTGGVVRPADFYPPELNGRDWSSDLQAGLLTLSEARALTLEAAS